MKPTFPTAIPEIPVRDLGAAISYYETRLGFNLDWKHEEHLAGVSRDKTRLFLKCADEGSLCPVRVWLNLESVAEVDSLHNYCLKSKATVTSAPEKKPWGLYEFTIEDCDGNSYRVFFDTQGK